MDDLAALDLATGEFQRLVDTVTDADLTLPTPCTEWDVHYLLAHVVGGNRFASMVLEGETSTVAIGRIMSTSQLGPRPGDDFTQTARQQRLGFRQPGSLEQPVDHPLGALTAARFLRFRIFDITLHAWDLAIALGTDPTLDTALVDTVLGIIRSEPPGMGYDLHPVAPPDDPDPLDHLLALSGRTTPGSDDRSGNR